MPIDSSIALQAQGPQNPLEQYGRALALKNALGQGQLQQGQIQAGQLENQQRQQALKGQQILDQAMSTAYTPGPDGTPTLNKSAVTDALTKGGMGHMIPGILKSFTENDEAVAKAKKATADASTAQDDARAASLYTVESHGFDPTVTALALGHAKAAGLISPQEADSLAGQIASNPTAENVKTLIQPYLDKSQAYQKLVDSRKTAKGAEDRGKAALDNSAREKEQFDINKPKLESAAAQQIRSDAAARLGAAQSDTEYQKILGALPYQVAKDFAGKTPEQARRLGMTAEQQTQADRAAKNSANTEEDRRLARKTAQGHLAVDQARLNLQQQQAGFEMGGGVSEVAKGIASGAYDAAATKRILGKNPGLMSQIKQVDPDFTELDIDKRQDVLKEFTSSSNSKAGGQVTALNTLVHHAGLYKEIAAELKNGTFKPGNALYNKVATIFGSAPPTQANLVAGFLAGETGKVATGGVPAEGEIHRVLQNLGNDGSPEQMEKAGDTLLQIAAGRMVPLQEKVDDAKLGKMVKILGPDATEILSRNGYDPKTMKKASSGSQITAPKVGIIEGGHRFKGGNPADPKNWEVVK